MYMYRCILVYTLAQSASVFRVHIIWGKYKYYYNNEILRFHFVLLLVFVYYIFVYIIIYTSIYGVLRVIYYTIYLFIFCISFFDAIFLFSFYLSSVSQPPNNGRIRNFSRCHSLEYDIYII